MEEHNPLGNVLSIIIFVSAVVFGGWYFYNNNWKGSTTVAQSAPTAPNSTSGTTP